VSGTFLPFQPEQPEGQVLYDGAELDERQRIWSYDRFGTRRRPSAAALGACGDRAGVKRTPEKPNEPKTPADFKGLAFEGLRAGSSDAAPPGRGAWGGGGGRSPRA